MTDSTRDATSRCDSTQDKRDDHGIDMDNLSLEDLSKHALVREALMAV